jgi:hypothetical protein
MGGGVFLRRGEGLVEMVEQRYELEDHLQELIERFPNLLAGDQVNPDAPRRWLMLSREVAVPGEEGGAGRWSLDHLLLDQDAIPTLVEVKRSSDSRIRREVVGQMLDYAANAVTYWNLDSLRESFEEAVRALDAEPEGEIAALVDDPDADYGEYWERAKTNLRAGRIRLVFVADVIPTELLRIVEFLNERMTPTEVIAVEIRQYTGGGEQVLRPIVLGQTAVARQRTSPVGSREWDEQSFLEELERGFGKQDAEVAREILDWSQRNVPRLPWGKGATVGSFAPAMTHAGRPYWLFYVYTYGKLEVGFQYMSRMPPFDQNDKRLELLRKLNEIPGVELPVDAITKRPRIPLATFAAPDALSMLFEVTEWFFAEARATNP